MPRQVTTTLDAMLDLSWLETYITLEVAFPNGEVRRWAGAYVQIPNESAYEAGVIRSGGLQQSFGTAVDVVEVTVANTDWWHSLTLLKSQARTFAPAIVGRLHKDYRTQSSVGWVWRSLLRGVVGAPQTNEAEATYTVISDLAAAGQVGATRTMMRPCGWRFKGDECGYSGPLATCDFTYANATGCAGRSRQFRYGGYIYDLGPNTLPGV